MALIDILVPVLSRPQNAQPLVDSIRAHTLAAHRILFLCSPGDEAQIDACRRAGEEVIVVDFSGESDYPRKMNVGYRETDSPFLFLGADDLTFEHAWDEIAIRDAGEAGVIGTNDCLNPQFRDGSNSTHPLVRRSYLDILGGATDGPGTLIHEGYDHNYCERELSGLAQQRGLYVYVAESVVRHRHPLFRNAPWDDTYRKGGENFARDRDLFLSRAHLWGFKGLSLAEQRQARRLRYSEAR